MGKIGDLWVRLGLKKNEFTAGMEAAKKETASFGESVKLMGGKVKLAFAAIAAAVVGVVNAIKDLAKQNQALGDAWNRMTAGMAAGWDTVKTAVASVDFSNFFTNIREAIRLSRELYDAQDALGEIGTAYDISLADQLKTINQLRIQLQDVNLSDKERLAAGERLLQIYSKLEKEPTRGLMNVSDAELNRMADKLGYNLKGASEEAMAATRQEVKDFFVWLGTAQGEAYNAAAQKVAQKPLGIDSALGQTFMRNAANNGLERFAQLAVAYNKNVNDKLRDQMGAAIRSFGEQAARFDAETRRIQAQMNSIRHSAAGAAGAGSGTEQSVDLYKQELEIIRQESAELAEIRAADEAIAAEADAAYQAWREAANLPPIKPFDEETMAKMERLIIEMKLAEEEMAKAKSKTTELSDAIRQNLVSAIEDGAVGAFDALADAMGGVTEGGMEQVAKALLEPLADMAIKVGTLVVMSSEAISGLRKALTSFDPTIGLIAGAALIAVGVAAKAGLAAIGNQGAGATGVTRYGADSGSAYGAGTISSELTVNVVGTIHGSDIILSGDNTLKSWGR